MKSDDRFWRIFTELSFIFSASECLEAVLLAISPHVMVQCEA